MSDSGLCCLGGQEPTVRQGHSHSLSTARLIDGHSDSIVQTNWSRAADPVPHSHRRIAHCAARAAFALGSIDGRAREVIKLLDHAP